MKIPIRNVGALGVFKDVRGYRLPPEAWTDVSNIQFSDGYAIRAKGETQREGAPTVPPYYLFPSPSVNSSLWTYTDLAKFYAVIGGTHTEITRGTGATPYTGGIDDKWNGGWLNGVMILNNGVDDPQAWNPIDPGTKLVDLPNWPATTKARVIRPFQNFLIGMDMTEGGTRFPTKVRWSHPADPGTVPTSWDVADPTVLAGSFPLSDTSGRIIDGASVGRSFMVYKEDALIRLDRVNTNAIFQPTWLSTRTGLMAQGCVATFAPGQQIALSLDADVLITDGQQVRSVTDRRVRKHLDQHIAGDFRQRCFVATNYKARQAFICYPLIGQEFCTQMAIWNWEDDTWSFKDITETLDMKSGIYDENAVAESWGSDSESWGSDDTVWGERLFVANSPRLLGAFPNAAAGVGQIREVLRGQTFDGVSYTSRLERTGLAVAGVDRQGNPKVNPNVVKLVTSVYPIIEASADVSFQVSVGAADHANGAITWDGPYAFDPRTEERVDVYVEGRYPAVRFESDSPQDWRMEGYILDVNPIGENY